MFSKTDDEVKINVPFTGFKTEIRVKILFNVNILPNNFYLSIAFYSKSIHFDFRKTTLSQEKHVSLKQGFLSWYY